ncbi:maleylpyruvate isomerase family mycothiol-dependent enzyme [Thalassiella azotivora]
MRGRRARQDERRHVWALVHAERTALLGDLAGLGAADWARASLCAGWTVHDVVAHLVDNARTTPVSFGARLVGAGFDFHRLNARGVERQRRQDPQETLRRLGEVAHRTSGAPAPLDSRLVEEVVHGEDVRRPLGLRRTYPPEAVARALLLQARTPAAVGGAKEVVARTRVVATDADLVLGNGPLVRGPALSLLLALSGRDVALADLAGPGTDVLVRESAG